MAEVFVFGSNLAGRHGAGSAKHALLNYGAVYGQGVGRQGNSYAIPTKDGRDGQSLALKRQTLPLEDILKHIAEFLDYARTHPEDRFRVVAIGTGYAGYKDEEIAPMFKGVPDNVMLPGSFKRVLKKMGDW